MHKPVMLYEVLKVFDIDPKGIYFDCTFGLGGHSINILKYQNKCGILHVLDNNFSFFKFDNFFYMSSFKNIFFHKCSFVNFFYLIDKLNLFGKVDCILFDLGISLNQLLDSNTGIGFSNNGFLDMRLNYFSCFRAIDWFNFANFSELLSVFSFFDKSVLSFNLVCEIINFRKTQLIKTTSDFDYIISKVCRFNFDYKNKFYQFIRIFINNDFQTMLDSFFYLYSSLKIGGCLLLISFNSIEDILIKSFFLKKKFFFDSYFNFLKPSIYELNNNFSSRSAMMRIFLKK